MVALLPPCSHPQIQLEPLQGADVSVRHKYALVFCYTAVK